MSMLDGVSQCWLLSRTCMVNWDAIAALGGWVAATVTFFAVLLPYQQYKKERRERDQLATEDAALRLITMLPVLVLAYTAYRFFVPRLESGELEKKEGSDLLEWIDSILAVAVPTLPWHPDFTRHRSALEMFGVSVRVLDSYRRRTLDAVARRQLVDALGNLDLTVRALVFLTDDLRPELDLQSSFPHYFSDEDS